MKPLGGSNMNKLSKFAFSCSVGFLFFISLNLVSQEVEEVVVTATKKAESVQDLALSIQAFTAEDVSENMIENMSDLAEVVPGLIMDKGIGSGASYSIRGTGSYGVGAAVVGAVVTASNGHSYNSSSIADIGFFDVERVEVLKGPQGTLFGRNAVAGVINMITARPTAEAGGYVELEAGNLALAKTNMHYNLPISDSIRTRLAFTSKKRDGVTENINTGNMFNDVDSWGARLSMDVDIGDDSTLKFTYETYESDDNRNNVGTSFCEPHPLYGCSPFVLGTPNTAADSRGSTAALFNLIGALNYTADANSYDGALSPNTFKKANLNREPVHQQTADFATIEFNHDINDDWSMVAKYSYSTRDYYHMNDNDYSVSVQPFPGLIPTTGIPMSWYGCFGGEGYGFCETIDSDRTYEFSVVNTDTQQGEISFISDKDGPVNFVLGAYTFDQRNNNRYQVQTASWNMISKAAQHPYNIPVFGGALTGYGGTDFFTAMVLGAPASLAPPGIFALLGLPKYEVPSDIQGFINEDHVRTKSLAVFGEMYVDLSEDTKLTVGLRWNDDTVKDSVGSCLTFFSCPKYPLSQKLTGEYGFFPTQVTETDDATAYKLALQHDLSDNQMVYASYTTAVKAGGNNPNSTGTPDPYSPEETGVFEIGTKSILMDGALLFNAAYYQNTTDGMLISSIVEAGSKNNNVDAEIEGFEGNAILFLSETTRLDFSWLAVETEIGDFALVNPLNPNGATQLLSPVINADPQGIVRYAVTDAGTIFKSAGSLCLAPFNPAGGVPCSNPGILTDVTGNQLPQSPELSYSLSLNQDYNTDGGVTTFRLTYRYQSERFGDVFNSERATMNEHKYFDTRITYQPNDANWFVSVYGKNLANDQFVGTWASASPLQGGTTFATYTDPRTWGVQFGTSF
jgi:outer membrane receptor protein involved in Fe transport